MTYIFLLINLFLVLIPIALSFDKSIFKKEQFKPAIPAILVSGIIFSAIAIFYAVFNIWSFNSAFLIGVFYRDLPLEQYLFAFTFSFAGLGIYNYLGLKFSTNQLQKYSLSISNLLLGICVAFLFFTYMKWYAVITFSVLFLLLFYIEYFNKLRFMGRFYLTYLICLVPFYIVNYIICSLNVVTYNQLESTRIGIANIPIENHFYVMALLLLSVYVMEFFKNRAAK